VLEVLATDQAGVVVRGICRVARRVADLPALDVAVLVHMAIARISAIERRLTRLVNERNKQLKAERLTK
jgi:hypothetical protein